MFTLLLISLLFFNGCTMQDCTYNVDKFMELVCFKMTSVEQLIDKINTTVIGQNSLPHLIKFLQLLECEFSNLTINSLRFLSELDEVRIDNSIIKRLASAEEPNEKNGMHF